MKRLACIFLALSLSSCQWFAKKKDTYRLVDVTKRTLSRLIEANGSVEALSLIEVFSPVPGRLEKIFVKEGDYVQARQKIALVSSESRSLFLDMAATKSKRDLEYWKTQLQPSPILAPTSGKIVSLKADLDDRVSGVVAQISRGEVIRADVDEADVSNLKLGHKAIIRFDVAPKIVLTGKLQEIAQTSRLVNNVNVYQCEVSIPPVEKRGMLPFEMKIGMSVTLSFPVDIKRDSLALPVAATGGRSMATVSFIRDNDEKVRVNLGEIYGDWVEVLSGLKAGDRLKIPSFRLQQQRAKKSPLMIRKD